jgi:DNA end-binding protein Ku
MTEHILDTKTGEFDPALLEDRYRTVLVEKLRERQAQMPTRSAALPSDDNVINLMDALRRSLATELPTSQRSTGATKPTSRRTTAAAKPTAAKRAGSKARKTG